MRRKTMIHKTRDASFKTIFANNELFAEFLRDFVSIEVFKEVRPGDIKDESAHFADLDREARDSDIVGNGEWGVGSGKWTVDGGGHCSKACALPEAYQQH
jgi:hypothetical protein